MTSVQITSATDLCQGRRTEDLGNPSACLRSARSSVPRPTCDRFHRDQRSATWRGPRRRRERSRRRSGTRWKRLPVLPCSALLRVSDLEHLAARCTDPGAVDHPGRTADLPRIPTTTAVGDSAKISGVAEVASPLAWIRASRKHHSGRAAREGQARRSRLVRLGRGASSKALAGAGGIGGATSSAVAKGAARWRAAAGATLWIRAAFPNPERDCSSQANGTAEAVSGNAVWQRRASRRCCRSLQPDRADQRADDHPRSAVSHHRDKRARRRFP
jgi:hypothetical protein